MKLQPLTFAALSAVALLVTAESGVVLDRVEHAAAGWRRAPAPVVATSAGYFAPGLARAMLCAVRS